MLYADLFREIRPDFLRLLGSPAARVYLDAADELERESALRPAALTRDEALAITERVVERHAEVIIEESTEQSVRERARAVIERLCGAGWLAADDRTDYRRFIRVEAEAEELPPETDTRHASTDAHWLRLGYIFIAVFLLANLA